MTKIKSIFLILNLALIATNIICANDKIQSIYSAYENGENIIFIFISEDKINKSSSTENALYDDWSYNLNEYSNSMPVKKVAFKVNNAVLSAVFKDVMDIKNELSLLFVKRGKKAILAVDAIVESYVYKYVDAYFQDKENDISIKDILGIQLKNIKTEQDILNFLHLKKVKLTFN